jgi:hypothetical protein
MGREAMTTGWKLRILGYMSKGDNVPGFLRNEIAGREAKEVSQT